MLRVIRVDSLLPPFGRHQALEARGDMTGREIGRLYAHESWGGSPVVVAHMGHVLEGDELDRPLLAGDVLVAPRIGNDLERVYKKAKREFGTFYRTHARALGLREIARVAQRELTNLVESLLPDPPDRGDDTSPTYSWQGVQTSSGIGFRIPEIYGRHVVGGQVIGADVEVGSLGTRTTGDREVLNLHLALGRGPIHKVGGIGYDADGLGDLWEDPRLPLPQDIRVNGVRLLGSGATASVRLGNLFQSPILGFERSRSSQPVNEDFERRGDKAVVVAGSTDATRLVVRIEFPTGLYREDGNGARHAEVVEFDLEYRPRSSLQGLFWSIPQRIRVAPPTARSTAFSHWYTFDVNSNDVPGFDGYEVRLTRRTESGDVRNTAPDAIIDSARWSELITRIDYYFAYPGIAQLALRIVASDRLQDGQPEVQIPVEGRLVRVFDSGVSAVLSTERYWDAPEAPDPYGGIWSHPPGRNPAWIALDILTTKPGLGDKGFVPNLNWFRDWADFCDQDDGLGGALCTCDIVFDRGENAWDALERVFRAGRASIVRHGRIVQGHYDYRDAHGRGTNVVPARARATIVCSSNLADFEIHYLETSQRPNVLQVSFLNEALDYEQDPLPVEDPAATWNDPSVVRAEPIRKREMDMFGVTRESQVVREALLIHARNRLVRKRVRFRAGIEQLAADVGDIVGVQHDAFRPWGERSVYFSCRLAEDTSGTRTLVLDRDLVVTDGPHSVIVQVIAPAGSAAAPITGYIIAEGNGAYPAGTALATSANQDPVDVVAKSVAVVGEWDGDDAGVGTAYGVEDFEILRRSLQEDGSCVFEARQWVPEAFDAAAPAAPLGELVDVEAEYAPPDVLAPSIEQLDVSVVELQRSARSGGHLVRWTMPEGLAGRPARVFIEDGAGAPDLVGESATGEVEVFGLDPALVYRVQVVPMDQRGTFGDPRGATAWEIQPPEWRPSAGTVVSDLVATDVADGVLLRWAKIRNPQLLGYEVRLGAVWNGARVLAEVSDPEVVLRDLVPGVAQQILVRARFDGGCDSIEPASVTVTPAVPEGFLEVATVERLTGSLTGYDSAGVEWTSGDRLVLEAGALDGYLYDAPIELTGEVNAEWRLQVDVEVAEEALVGDDDRPVGDPEECYADVAGRAPSAVRPGDDFGTLDDDDIELGADELPVYGPQGIYGEYARVVVEVAWKAEDNSWSAWEPWKGAQRRRAKGIRVALRLQRTNEDYVIHVRRLAVAAVA